MSARLGKIEPAPFLDNCIVPAGPGCFISWSDLGRHCMHKAGKSPPMHLDAFAWFICRPRDGHVGDENRIQKNHLSSI